jgi:hypothetical protein
MTLLLPVPRHRKLLSWFRIFGPSLRSKILVISITSRTLKFLDQMGKLSSHKPTTHPIYWRRWVCSIARYQPLPCPPPPKNCPRWKFLCYLMRSHQEPCTTFARPDISYVENKIRQFLHIPYEKDSTIYKPDKWGWLSCAQVLFYSCQCVFRCRLGKLTCWSMIRFCSFPPV